MNQAPLSRLEYRSILAHAHHGCLLCFAPIDAAWVRQQCAANGHSKPEPLSTSDDCLCAKLNEILSFIDTMATWGVGTRVMRL